MKVRVQIFDAAAKRDIVVRRDRDNAEGFYDPFEFGPACVRSGAECGSRHKRDSPAKSICEAARFQNRPSQSQNANSRVSDKNRQHPEQRGPEAL